jgi:hypothetical protein
MKNGVRSYLKKLGLAGFLFFLIKGIVWLLIFLGMGNWIMDWFA